MIGCGKSSEIKERDFLKFGGALAGKLNAASSALTVFAELAEGAMAPDQAAALAMGVRLRAYRFDRYKTKKKEGEILPPARGHFGRGRGCRRDAESLRARRAYRRWRIIARDLVNEPPNVLYPEEFARRAAACASSASWSRCSMSRR